MIILHICITGPYTDGFNYQENLLTKYQVKNGNDVHIIASEWQWGKNGKIEKCVEKTEYRNAEGVIVHRLKIKGDRDIFFRYKRFENFYETIERLKPEIIFVHNLQFFDVDKIVKYAKKNKIRIYADNHADFSNSARSKVAVLFYKIVWRYMAKMIEPYTTKFYGVLPARVDFLREIYKLPDKKCELLIMGADDEEVERAGTLENQKKVRNDLNIKDEEFVIVTGGKIDEWKTQTLLLMDAVKNLSNDNVRLLIFGPVADSIKEKFDLLFDKSKMRYISWADTKAAYDYFAIADLVVFPGRHSVYWEQVVGQEKPMLCKYWKGTTHVDCGGNVRFLMTDSAKEIEQEVKRVVCNEEILDNMKIIAEGESKKKFLYSSIAKKSIT